MPKLIIIRGPSGSGKSTVSKELLKRSKHLTLLVGEDKLRKMFSDHTKTPHPVSEHLALEAIKIGLKSGYDVIYQGILNADSREFRLEELQNLKPDGIYLFYLNVSFEETVRRHETRHKRSEFGADAMERWWKYSSPLHHEFENLISESASLEDALEIISREAVLDIAKDD